MDKQGEIATHSHRSHTLTSLQILSYGFDTSSPVESGHAGLKGWLGSSKSDVLTFFRKMAPFFSSAVDRYYSRLGQVQNRASRKFINMRCYDKVVRVVSSRGLKAAHKQRLEMQTELLSLEVDRDHIIKPCTGVFRSIYGAPCSHD